MKNIALIENTHLSFFYIKKFLNSMNFGSFPIVVMIECSFEYGLKIFIKYINSTYNLAGISILYKLN